MSLMLRNYLANVLEILQDQRPIALAVNSRMRRWWKTTGKFWLQLELILLLFNLILTFICVGFYFGQLIQYVLDIIRAFAPAITACVALFAAIASANASWQCVSDLQKESALPSSVGRSLYLFFIALRQSADSIAVYLVGYCVSTVFVYLFFDIFNSPDELCRYPFSALPEALSSNITFATGIAVLAVIFIAGKFIFNTFRTSVMLCIVASACEGVVAAHNYTTWDVAGWAGWQPPYDGSPETTIGLNLLMVLFYLGIMATVWTGMWLRSRIFTTSGIIIFTIISLARLMECTTPYVGPQSVSTATGTIAFAASRAGYFTCHGIAEYGLWQSGSSTESISTALRIFRLPYLTVQAGDGAALVALLISVVWLCLVIALYSLAVIRKETSRV